MRPPDPLVGSGLRRRPLRAAALFAQRALKAPATRAALVGGAIGGALDLAYALAWAGSHGVMPVRLLQVIASGLLGESAYAGGIAAAILGLCAHFALSCLWARAFVALAARRSVLLAHPVRAGLAFGVAVYLAMNLVVLPLSAFPHPVAFRFPAALGDLASHMGLFGVPIAKVAAAFAARERSAA